MPIKRALLSLRWFWTIALDIHIYLDLSGSTDSRLTEVTAHRPGVSAEEAAALARGMGDLPVSAERALRAFARTAGEFAALVAEALTTAEAAAVLGVPESRVRQRLAARTLYGIKTDRGWRLPRFQFTARGEVPGGARVWPRLPRDLHPLAVRNWFTRPTWELVWQGEPASPREWLRAGGDPRDVARLAALL